MLKQPSLKAHSSPSSSMICALIKTLLNVFNVALSSSSKSSSSAKGEASIINKKR